MSKDTKTGAMPIAFPAALHKTHDARWFVDGRGSFMADARTRMAGAIASMIPNPGIWKPGGATSRMTKIGEVDTERREIIEAAVAVAHAKQGQPCDVIGDIDDLMFDTPDGKIGNVDANQVMEAGPAAWSVVAHTGEEIGVVDGHKFVALTRGDRLTYRFDRPSPPRKRPPPKPTR